MGNFWQNRPSLCVCNPDTAFQTGQLSIFFYLQTKPYRLYCFSAQDDLQKIDKHLGDFFFSLFILCFDLEFWAVYSNIHLHLGKTFLVFSFDSIILFQLLRELWNCISGLLHFLHAHIYVFYDPIHICTIALTVVFSQEENTTFVFNQATFAKVHIF